MRSLDEVFSALEQIACAKGTRAKEELIALHAGDALFREVVFLALDPYRRYKMSGDLGRLAEAKKVAPNSDPAPILARLVDFAARPSLSKEEKTQFASLVLGSGPQAVEVVNRILKKDLRCGASVLTFRKASEQFASLPLHQPMKGGDDWDRFFKHAGGRENICWSYKLDGTRTWAVVDGSGIIYLSSNGHELPNFRCFDTVLRQAASEIRTANSLPACARIIFDGEVVNVSGDFSRHMSQFRRLHDMDPSGFRFRIFDCLLPDDKRPFQQRLTDLLRRSFLPLWHPGETIALCSVLGHQTLTERPSALARQAVDLGLEGIMLKTWDYLYQCKRSADWCKVKPFKTEDLRVVDKIEGTGKYAGMLGSLVVERNGVRVEVGSGFKDAERREFWLDPPACIEVRFQDALASGSLRFPTFVRVRDDKEI